MHTHYFFSIKWILSTGSIFTCPARYCFWSPAFVCLLASLRLQLSLRNIQRYWDNGVIGLTRSSAVAERPRDASFLSVDSFIQYVERNLLLFAVLPLQIYRCARTDKFCSSVLFCSAYSLMRGDLCHKQTCTVTVTSSAPTTVNCRSHYSSSNHRSTAGHWPVLYTSLFAQKKQQAKNKQ